MNIRLMEAFSKEMAEYIGKVRWAKMEKYLSGFDYYTEASSKYFKFPDADEAFRVTKKIMEDAKAKKPEAQDYILFRCAGMINTSSRKYNSAVLASGGAHTDITGTLNSFDGFVGYLSEAYLKLVEPEGVIEKFPLDRYSYGDLMDNVSARLGLELKNLGRKLNSFENNNGVNYDGVRSESVCRFDKETGKYYVRKSGKEVTKEEAEDLQHRADIRRMGKATSFDGTSTNDSNDDAGRGSSMDKLMADYADASGDNLGEFEDKVIEEMDGPELIENWKSCCMDMEWEKKNCIKAKLLKTLLDDMVAGRVTDQKSFIDKYHINKQTFRNYMGLTPRDVYDGVTIRDIVDDYEVDISELVKYMQENPSKKDVLLDMLPGERLHEALKRYMHKRLVESRKLRESTANNMVSLSEDVLPYFESFKEAINEAIATVDWSETDGTDLKEILESTLKDGIDAHKNTWKFMAGALDVGMNKFQKKMVCDILR